MLTLRNWWVLFALTMGVYAVMVVWTLPQIAKDADGLMPFDMRFAGYSPAEARAFLAALGERGLELYTGWQRGLDLAYPPLLAATLCGAVWMLFARTRWRVVLCAAAVVGMAADLTENARVAVMLAEVAPTDAQIIAASQATLVKSVLTTVAMVGVLSGLGLAGWRRWAKGAKT
jgi:hypothetical protein